jgi:hypothetical protein
MFKKNGESPGFAGGLPMFLRRLGLVEAFGLLCFIVIGFLC